MKSIKYYIRIQYEDYLTRDSNNRWWLGRGRDSLSLVDPVDPVVLERLFRGVSPDNKIALVMNAGSDKRRAAVDLVLSVPKGFSVFRCFAAPDVQARLDAVLYRAAVETVRYIEENIAYVRIGKGGKETHRAAIVVAVFLHLSNRNLEPQVHLHCLLLNLGITDGNKTNSLLIPVILDHTKEIGAMFRASLATELQRELGLAIERRGDFWEIPGVPSELIEAFSSRRATIKRVLDEHGWTSSKASTMVTLATRPEKREVNEAVISHWHHVGKEHGFSTSEAAQLIPVAPPAPRAVQAGDDLHTAVRRRLEGLKTFREKDVLRAYALEAPGRGLAPNDILALTQAFIASNDIEVSGHRRDQDRYVHRDRSREWRDARYVLRDQLELEEELEWEY